MSAVESLASAAFALMLERAQPKTDAEAIRLGGFAHDVAVASWRDSASPKIAAKRAALLLAISWHESRWRDDALGDFSRSCTAWQIHVGREACRPLVADRLLAADTALELAERSINACRKQPRAHRLAAYASGRCSAGHRESARMVAMWWRWTPRLVAAVEAN